MKAGEDATWAGVLLSGEISAILPNGTVVGCVVAGSVVGEMALFRGGKRGCDMRANNSGEIALLRFGTVQLMESVTLMQKLMLAFGKEAYLHSVLPQSSPSLKPFAGAANRSHAWRR